MKKRSSLKFPPILSPNVGASLEETNRTYPLCDQTFMPNIQRRGACFNFAYDSMQLYNPGDPKGQCHCHSTMPPPKYAPGVGFLQKICRDIRHDIENMN